MKNISKLTLIAIAILSSTIINSQTVLISDADYDANNPCDCANGFSDNSIFNFYDTGGSGGNYADGENEVIVFCPNGANQGSKMALTIAQGGQGFVWDVDATDTMFVYDGPTTASPLIVKGNTDSHPIGFAAPTASFTNLSGCLTVEFKSDGATNAAGWKANIACSTPWQPMELHISGFIGSGEANGAGDTVDDFTNTDLSGPEPDTGYVNVCLGDSILFVNTTAYINEPGAPNGPSVGGYNQSDPANHTTTWSFSNGYGASGDSIWFTPPGRAGYIVTMRVEDTKGFFDNMQAVIRVSTTPSFATCRPVDSSFCLGLSTELIGGVTAQDTAGVDPTQGNVSIGGSFGNPLFIPDVQTQIYSTSITISGFPSGTTIANVGDLEKICVEIEHSWLGDLEMQIECPNSFATATLFNSYDGSLANQLVPGGFGGGGDFLGGADDNSTNVGVCEEYCFSENSGALPAWVNGYPTVAASGPSTGQMVAPGTYLPEESFASALAGCSLNGTWTLIVKDNIGSDDGNICSWGIFLNASLNPNSESYTTSIVSDQWQADPTIVVDNDTTLEVRPILTGTHQYTFEVEDNYGCAYDTTINVYVIEHPVVTPMDETCDTIYQYAGNTSPVYGGVSGGHWELDFLNSNGTVNYVPDSAAINPTINVSNNGVYNFRYIDNVCGDTVTSRLLFLADPNSGLIAKDTICLNDTVIFSMGGLLPGESIIWTGPTGDTLHTSDSLQVIGSLSGQGQYTYVLSNICNTDRDSVDLVVSECLVPNVITPNGDGENDFFTTNYARIYDDVHLIIYNRWGRKVYENANYDNTWGGEKTNGKDLHESVFYYVLTWDNASKSETGFVHVFDK